MYKSVFWMTGLLFGVVIAGPLAMIAQQSGRLDSSDLYLLLNTPAKTASSEIITAFGARETGPIRGRLGRLIVAPPRIHARLHQSGYILLPASAAAAICGIAVITQPSVSRS